MRLFLFIYLITSSVFALESSDIFNTQILKAYNQNVLVLNRGLEDAIYRNDHMKLTNTNGFIARGICVKVTLLTSHWKIYRVVRPELVSKDTVYQMRSINQSQIPKDIARLKRVDFTEFFSDYGDRNVKKQLRLQDKRIAQYDLPKRADKTEFYKLKSKSSFDQFVERNFEDQEYKEDFSNTYFEVFASPYTIESLYDQKQSHYGGRLYNRGTKFLYELSFLERQRRIVDPFNQARSYDNKSTQYKVHFQLNRVTDNWSLISYAQFDREKFGPIYYPHRFIRGGIFGFKYHVFEDNPKTDFWEISYTPAFDLIEYNNLEVASTDSLEERQGYRHTFEMLAQNTLSKKWHHRFMLHYAPFTQNFVSDFDWGDNMLNIENTFSYDLESGFFFDYTLQYMRDELRADIYNIRADNSINTFRLRYEFDI